MTEVPQWVQDLVAKHSGGHVPLEVGKYYQHKGRIVFITSGQYWGTHGISNFWYWCPVDASGQINKNEEEHGYDNEGAFTPIDPRKE